MSTEKKAKEAVKPTYNSGMKIITAEQKHKNSILFLAKEIKKKPTEEQKIQIIILATKKHINGLKKQGDIKQRDNGNWQITVNQINKKGKTEKKTRIYETEEDLEYFIRTNFTEEVNKNYEETVEEIKKQGEIIKNNKEIDILNGENQIAKAKIHLSNLNIKKYKNDLERTNTTRMANLNGLSKINFSKSNIETSLTSFTNSAKFQANALGRDLAKSLDNIKRQEKQFQGYSAVAKQSIQQFDANIAAATTAYLNTQQKNFKALQDKILAEKALKIAEESNKTLKDLSRVTSAQIVAQKAALDALTAAFEEQIKGFTTGFNELGSATTNGFGKVAGALVGVGGVIAGLINTTSATGDIILNSEKDVVNSKIELAKFDLNNAEKELLRLQEQARIAYEQLLQELENWKKGIPPPEIVKFLNTIRCDNGYAWGWDPKYKLDGHSLTIPDIMKTAFNREQYSHNTSKTYHNNNGWHDVNGSWRCIIGTQAHDGLPRIDDWPTIQAVAEQLSVNGFDVMFGGRKFHWGVDILAPLDMNYVFHLNNITQIDYKTFGGLSQSYFYNRKMSM